MRTGHRIHLLVVCIREAGGWVVQALEHDFAAQGETEEQALRNLAHTIGSHIYAASLRGISDPLAAVKPAPRDYWELFQRAAMQNTQSAELEAPGLPPAFVIKAIADARVQPAY